MINNKYLDLVIYYLSKNLFISTKSSPINFFNDVATDLKYALLRIKNNN